MHVVHIAPQSFYVAGTGVSWAADSSVVTLVVLQQLTLLQSHLPA
jgi:hypothetical protein